MKIYSKIKSDKSFGGNFYEKDIKDDWEITEKIYDNEFLKEYWNGSEWVENATTEELELVKQQKIHELNKLQFEELLVTDWYIIRKLDIGTEIPIEIINQRNEIRLKYNNLRNELL